MTLYATPAAAKRAGHAALHSRHLASFRLKSQTQIEPDRSRSRGWAVVLFNRLGEPVTVL
jgi:hypothetical protein